MIALLVAFFAYLGEAIVRSVSGVVRGLRPSRRQPDDPPVWLYLALGVLLLVVLGGVVVLFASAASLQS